MSRKTIQVSVDVIPIKGKVQSKTVTVSASTTVEEVLAAAGIDSEHKDITVDGRPATVSTRVTEGGAVRVTERPQGS